MKKLIIAVCLLGAVNAQASEFSNAPVTFDNPATTGFYNTSDLPITGKNNQPLVTFTHSGKIIIGAGASRDKATQEFLATLIKVYPAWFKKMQCKTTERR